MVGIKGNRRILYTKKVIKESLIELLQHKKIHEVTVTDICKNANINRGTFYSHYKDTYDLLKSIEDELFNQILEYIEETPVEDYKNILLLKALELIDANKKLCKILFSKQMENNIMDRIIYVANKAEIDKLISSSKINDVFLEYFIKYSVGGVFSVIQTWLENDLNESPQEITNIINDIISFYY
ncbi:TetR/AcrR family transcriptional regulator [Clostridium sporogenes]|uniref:TetR/AcrR family transcriptional regulator n=1 Tax=Clostridium botulinum TaxID=1491 RepID=A0A6M0SVL7_CLOBO|nr:TetR/AcrR family transcriptional regulator [Clostridium sporogenes]NFA59577.1 TetR/AcrR family transcriptional regulator [Clostridium botulinum]NFI73409.1 TetR family transcriptional regulator [Clostridium sporogenes]NFL71461.1 TetR family transcriptional regulator [Clostridium sporogenes]NFM23268.1 TetR family transcriptional regulator [Clostridium sporogenes]NFP61343.1 TetR family transcriptional regulator [Clostridium sporogenes]